MCSTVMYLAISLKQRAPKMMIHSIVNMFTYKRSDRQTDKSNYSETAFTLCGEVKCVANILKISLKQTLQRASKTTIHSAVNLFTDKRSDRQTKVISTLPLPYFVEG